MNEPQDHAPAAKNTAKARLATMGLTILTIVVLSIYRDSQTSLIGYLSMFPTYLSAPSLRTKVGQIIFLVLVVVVLIWATATSSSDLWPLFFWVPVPVGAWAIRALERRNLAVTSI